MTYYEELGLAQTASVEEIRHAYRRLARLVHPDQFGESDSRRLAELQMMRLNGVLATLTDHEQRSRYDASLMPSIGGTRAAVLSHRQAIYAGMLVLALVGIAAALRPKRPAAPNVAATPAAPAAQIVPKKIARPRQSPVAAPSQPNAELADAPEIETSLPNPPDPLPTVVQPILPIAPPIDIAIPAAAAIPRLTGRWLFAGSRTMEHVGYLPEYIELRLSESSGVIRGLYRARYRVTDRAISPDVAFRFEGPVAPDGGVLPWQGTGGSKGEVTLRLLPVGGLEVGWVAHQLGQQLGLISGSATLVRKLE
jgi:hypothetical protein